MIDLYLHAPTREAMVADLAPLGLAVDGKLVTASHVHALAIIVDDADGVTVAVRCADDDLAGALSTANFPAGTVIMAPPERIPRFAGGDVLDLSAIAHGKSQEAKDAAEAFLAPYAAEYGAIEMASWPVQLKEAEDLQSDPGAATPWLDAASTARGMPKAELATRVIANAAAWSTLQGFVNGQRLKFQDQVDAILGGEETDTMKALGILGVEVAYQMPVA